MAKEGPSHRLKPVPDKLVGRAVRDKAFRNEVLKLKDNKKDLDAYLKSEGFKELPPAAYDAIKKLDANDVNLVLSEIDEKGFEDIIAG